ncbi:hypothetical protein A3736_14445 [Erythrobacter sp. HI0063]|jgi:hypothetical protein|uniref:hypothetical protein n=1 Tax=Erythrobacter sp. HI0063 TaxID=1822240 RepID=UPI0007C3FF84|nr:hypothetical protein [Erythrobacter sp. HI0063]KZY54376.1 hypothetical protein A3736_14445 [Erythrobacter sp. HI0063]
MPTLIVVPDLTGAPLAALKEWLAISGPREDALLLRLLAAGWETCARFVEPSAMPADWAGLPSALAEGIVRFAAWQYRERDGGVDRPPPAAIAALWRPYRTLRL